MIDTVTIFSTSFRVKKENKLDICMVNYDPSRFDKPRYFFSFLEDGSYCFAYNVSALCNGFRIRIYNIGGFNSSSLNISFEIPSLFEGHNLNPIGTEQVRQIEGKLKDVLDSVGIEVDLKSFKIKRIDLFKNIALDHEVEEYAYIMNYIKSIQAGALTKIEDTTYKGNESYKVALYDKGHKISSYFGIDFAPIKGRKLARFEIRLMNEDICSRVFKKNNLLNTINVFCTRSGYRKLHKFFYSEIKRLFYFDMEVGTIDCHADMLNAERLVKMGEKPTTVAALLTCSKHCNEGNFEEFIETITDGNASRRSVVRKRILEKIDKYKLYSPAVAIRYNEIKRKLLIDLGIKSIRQKCTTKKSRCKLISSNEEFLVFPPDIFVVQKEEPKHKFVEIEALFYEKASSGDVQK